MEQHRIQNSAMKVCFDSGYRTLIFEFGMFGKLALTHSAIDNSYLGARACSQSVDKTDGPAKLAHTGAQEWTLLCKCLGSLKEGLAIIQWKKFL